MMLGKSFNKNILWIIQILIVLILALILDKRAKNAESKKKARKFLWRVIAAIILLYPVLVLMEAFVLYQFVGADILYGWWLEPRSEKNRGADIFAYCAPNETVYTKMLSRGLIRDISYMSERSKDVNLLIKNMIDKASDITFTDTPKNSSKKIMMDATAVASMFKDGDMCVAIRDELNIDYLRNLHNKISAFASNHLESEKFVSAPGLSAKDLTLCNLKYLNAHIIKKLISSEMLIKAQGVVGKCKILAALFSDTIAKEVQTYLLKANRTLSSYDHGFKAVLSNITDNLKDMYKSRFTNYITMASNALNTRIGLCGHSPEVRLNRYEIEISAMKCLLYLLKSFLVGLMLVLLALIGILIVAYKLANTRIPIRNVTTGETVLYTNPKEQWSTPTSATSVGNRSNQEYIATSVGNRSNQEYIENADCTCGCQEEKMNSAKENNSKPSILKISKSPSIEPIGKRSSIVFQEPQLSKSDEQPSTSK